MLELRFHPDEKCSLEPVLLSESHAFPTAYISRGTELRGDHYYDVVTLSFHYKDNLATGLGNTCFPKSPFLGYHPNDVEFISLYYNKHVLEYVYFSAHGPGQGMYVAANEVELTECGDIVVYVAKNSHACYPHPGTYLRIFGLANDVCSKRGNSLVISDEELIPSFNYVFNNGIRLYAGLRPPPPTQSVTALKRFFLPYYVNSLREGAVTSLPSVDSSALKSHLGSTPIK